METSAICKSYFNGLKEISNFKGNSARINTVAVFKIFSYFTVILPIVFGAVLGYSLLCSRVSKKENISQSDSDVNDVAKRVLSPGSDSGVQKSQQQPEIKSMEAHSGVQKSQQPEIKSMEEKTVVVHFNGRDKTFENVVILPHGNAKKWELKPEQNSITHDDIEKYIMSVLPYPEIVIISLGRGENNLKVEKMARNLILMNKIQLFEMKTDKAIKKYRELSKEDGGKRVAAMICMSR